MMTGSAFFPNALKEQGDPEEFGVSPVERIARAISEAPFAALRIETIENEDSWIRHVSGSDQVILGWRPIEAVALEISETVRFLEQAIASSTAEYLHRSALNEMQLQLPIRDPSFRVNKTLIELWRTNINELTEEGGERHLDLHVRYAADFEIAHEFVRVLSAMFGSIAQYLRYQERPALTIASAGRFSSQIQIAICEEFLIVPDQAADFLNALRTELVEALQRGWKIQGPWGKVVMEETSNDLRFELLPIDAFSDKDFIEAIDVTL